MKLVILSALAVAASLPVALSRAQEPQDAQEAHEAQKPAPIAVHPVAVRWEYKVVGMIERHGKALDYLKKAGDPATDKPIGDVGEMLESAIAGETHEYTDMYPSMARTARDEGFGEIADWFETLAKAERSHAGKFAKAKESYL